MENIFENLWKDKEMPESAKKEVLNTMAGFKLMVDIVDLFTVKNIKANGSILGALAESVIEDNNKDIRE